MELQTASKHPQKQFLVCIFGKMANMETKVKARKIRNKKKGNNTLKTKKPLSDLFGINKKEVDGLQFQKKVRNEWQ